MDDAGALPIRTLLVSDVHLGCKHSQSKQFLHFLRRFEPESLYIVGDFIDTWKINSGWHWSSECDEVIERLVFLNQQGTKIFYVPGNHDSFLRTPGFDALMPAIFSQFEVANEFIFETASGWKLLVTHGDLFDVFETKAQWLSKGSSIFYDSALSLNRWMHHWFLHPNENPYGVCAILKGRVKRAVQFISRYERSILQHARWRECHGIVCGHIHTPAIPQTPPADSDSLVYLNTGDWVENCTGLVEHHDGLIQLMSLYGDHQSIELPLRSGDGSESVDEAQVLANVA
ncbi:UDP-2,3-diacylglucosamine diphosphatase [Neorhodopirellula pilleata]|uniref:UDP-2,3-diacylglucosamine hydrolase n=1 Tax=Neorhodopirellula pilleata TaxID=2714738 RepID=A0A5C5ZZ22_9BACT|nr:UDP-2,3-diacylglucosamine diphosphatase [Neorhodopirellula pilleata]TWT92529.1 UDP-2,3-diacylglucosamine hydrolase [Neorhodopirellula pilleata]